MKEKSIKYTFFSEEDSEDAPENSTPDILGEQKDGDQTLFAQIILLKLGFRQN